MGKDSVEVQVRITARPDPGQGPELHETVWITTTWDTMLAVVGPQMVDECSERQMKSNLASGIVGYDLDHASQQVMEKVGYSQEEWTGAGYRPRSAEMSNVAFSRVLLQFKALNYVARSERKRSLKDTETYWSLTARGEAVLLPLQAYKRKSGPAALEDGQSNVT